MPEDVGLSQPGRTFERMRALIYARVSIDRQGRSLTEQEAECREWATREGWDVVDVITEAGSASRYARSTGSRQRWDDLTAAISSGRIDLLLTWEASRATRQLSEYAVMADLCAEHGVLYGYSGTVHDLTTRDARFRTGLDALLAQDESARTSERIQRSTRARAVAGRPHGKLPYGYRRDYDPQSGALLRQVPDEETAPIVQEIVRRVIAGRSLRSIAADLTDRHVPPPRPARNRARSNGWLSVTVRRLAMNPTHAGLRVHQGQIVGDAAWPAIITREQHEKAVAILTDPGRDRRASADSTARHLLSGIAICGLCGDTVRYLHSLARDSRTYACKGCHRLGRAQAPLEEHVTSTVLALLAAIDAKDIDSSSSPELDTAREALTGLEQRLEGFTLAAADGEVSPAALAKIEGRLVPQIRQARQRVRVLAIPSGIDPGAVADPATWWGAASMEQRRALLRATVRIVLQRSPATKSFLPECVEITPTW